MEDLATAVVLQDEPIQQAEQHTDNVKHDTEAGNVQLDKGIESARRARKLKWWCFFICLAIVISQQAERRTENVKHEIETGGASSYV